jgi:hypothetical protein
MLRQLAGCLICAKAILTAESLLSHADEPARSPQVIRANNLRGGDTREAEASGIPDVSSVGR